MKKAPTFLYMSIKRQRNAVWRITKAFRCRWFCELERKEDKMIENWRPTPPSAFQEQIASLYWCRSGCWERYGRSRRIVPDLRKLESQVGISAVAGQASWYVTKTEGADVVGCEIRRRLSSKPVKPTISAAKGVKINNIVITIIAYHIHPMMKPVGLP